MMRIVTAILKMTVKNFLKAAAFGLMAVVEAGRPAVMVVIFFAAKKAFVD